MSTSVSGQPPGALPVVRESPYDKLKAAILNGTLAPGAPLVESSVAQWCGVSRTPVREALTRLEQDGLVTRGERGLVVRERSPEEILDIYDVRIVLEETAARLAAERHTAFDLVRLDRLLRTGEEIDPNDHQALAASNREFHRGVWRAGRNEALMDLLSRLNSHLVRYPLTTLSHPGRLEQALAEHRQLVEAIGKRDSAAAAEVAREHFTTARDIRLHLWEQDLA